MKPLLIATTNPAKFEEAAEGLSGDGIEIRSLKDFPDIIPVEEIGDTFEENAVLKAKGYFEQTHIPCIADDGGLMIDYLGGAPGVHSNRWLGRVASSEELAHAIIEKMAGVEEEKRTARLGGFIIFWDGVHMLKQECWLEGYIAEQLMGEIKPGFPYRPLLMIPQFGKPYSELTQEEHDQVNFRRKNLRALKPEMLKLLGKST
ncbi:MAG: non-canonical purine NTP pyrophosphatase [Candidatus Sungbacteria bacterium]|nr:non-canonical purine NTP pyrophosphatase [bacterium]MDZ4260091.1 non-canonical purine NTP pyrophosphatase [Candidatus Sungbacteria bacterium]